MQEDAELVINTEDIAKCAGGGAHKARLARRLGRVELDGVREVARGHPDVLPRALHRVVVRLDDDVTEGDALLVDGVDVRLQRAALVVGL
jgi:hypothetical protein